MDEQRRGERRVALSSRTKVSLGLLGAIAVALWPLHQWLSVHLENHVVTSAKGDALAVETRKAADAAQMAAEATHVVAVALADHIAMTELKDARQRLDLLKTDLATTQLWEAANHPNDISRARVRDLGSQIDHVQNWIACTEAGRPATICGPL
jgi:hypothetical protein